MALSKKLFVVSVLAAVICFQANAFVVGNKQTVRVKPADKAPFDVRVSRNTDSLFLGEEEERVSTPGSRRNKHDGNDRSSQTRSLVTGEAQSGRTQRLNFREPQIRISDQTRRFKVGEARGGGSGRTRSFIVGEARGGGSSGRTRNFTVGETRGGGSGLTRSLTTIEAESRGSRDSEKNVVITRRKTSDQSSALTMNVSDSASLEITSKIRSHSYKSSQSNESISIGRINDSNVSVTLNDDDTLKNGSESTTTSKSEFSTAATASKSIGDEGSRRRNRSGERADLQIGSRGAVTKTSSPSGKGPPSKDGANCQKCLAIISLPLIGISIICICLWSMYKQQLKKFFGTKFLARTSCRSPKYADDGISETHYMIKGSGSADSKCAASGDNSLADNGVSAYNTNEIS